MKWSGLLAVVAVLSTACSSGGDGAKQPGGSASAGSSAASVAPPGDGAAGGPSGRTPSDAPPTTTSRAASGTPTSKPAPPPGASSGKRPLEASKTYAGDGQRELVTLAEAARWWGRPLIGLRDPAVAGPRSEKAVVTSADGGRKGQPRHKASSVSLVYAMPGTSPESSSEGEITSADGFVVLHTQSDAPSAMPGQPATVRGHAATYFKSNTLDQVPQCTIMWHEPSGSYTASYWVVTAPARCDDKTIVDIANKLQTVAG